MADFATRLRALRKERKLRQIDLAGEMGVAQTTIANYEQHTRFPDEDTLGKFANLFDVSLDYLLGRSDAKNPQDFGNRTTKESPPATLPPLAERYLKLMRRGSRNQAYSLILDAAKTGTGVREIYGSVFEPALKEVGRLWEIGEVDVAEEHYISGATESLMALLHPYLEQPAEKRGVVVAVAANGELHQIGLKMITDRLTEMGWDCYYIGVNTPTPDLIRVVEERRADVLAISATMPLHVDTVSGMIFRIRSSTAGKHLRIVVGGQAFDGDLSRRVGADGYARDLEELTDLMAAVTPQSK